MTAWLALLRQEIRVVLREGGAVGTVLGFYAIVITMMPIALGPDLKLLARIAPPPGVLTVFTSDATPTTDRHSSMRNAGHHQKPAVVAGDRTEDDRWDEEGQQQDADRRARVGEAEDGDGEAEQHRVAAHLGEDLGAEEREEPGVPQHLLGLLAIGATLDGDGVVDLLPDLAHPLPSLLVLGRARETERADPQRGHHDGTEIAVAVDGPTLTADAVHGR